eukprot:gene15336-18142_t
MTRCVLVGGCWCVAAIHFEQEDVQYWLNVDRDVECYTRRWFLFAMLSTFVIVTFSLGMPLMLVALTHYLHDQKEVMMFGSSQYVSGSSIIRVIDENSNGRLEDGDKESSASRHTVVYKAPNPVTGLLVPVQPVFIAGLASKMQTRLANPVVLQYVGGYMVAFKPKYFYWTGYDMLVRLAQSSMVILVRMIDEQYDLIYMCLICTCALAVHSYVKPYRYEELNIFQTLVLLSQSTITLSCIATRYTTTDDTARLPVMGIIMVIIQVVLVLGALKYIFLELYRQMTEKDSFFNVFVEETLSRVSTASNNIRISLRARLSV